ncbi:MAG: hypothetical protein E6I94_07195 [Chloroflexi bacterium]|nr:MAG: hypothetical protein E6I94_07195 [Chloroflexota bacterium]
MLEPIASALAVAALVAVFLWFAVGTQLNVRRGNAILRWLQGGLPLIGRRTTMRWLGSSAVELVIAEPSAPFRTVTLVFVMEPRDLPWLWALTRTRGRRDLLIIRAELRRSPRAELEVATIGSWSASLPVQPGDDMASLDPIDWPSGNGEVVEAHAGPGVDLERAVRSWDALDRASGGVMRVSIRRSMSGRPGPTPLRPSASSERFAMRPSNSEAPPDWRPRHRGEMKRPEPMARAHLERQNDAAQEVGAATASRGVVR